MLARCQYYLTFCASQNITKHYYQASKSHGHQNHHSRPENQDYGAMEIKILPALQDNYMYLVVDKETKEAAAIDPAEPTLLMQAVKYYGLNLTTVLTTHHHWDHAGGNNALSKTIPGLKIYGGDDRIRPMTQKVKHDDILGVGSLTVRCLSTPCHTSGHMCYLVTSPNNSDGKGGSSVVFTGDTLYLGGCGKFLEGTVQQMYSTLNNILSGLSDKTKVFGGHEYSVPNLKFALSIEPQNIELSKKMNWSQMQRRLWRTTVPSTIGEEKSYNPFMRVDLPVLKKHANTDNSVKAMQALRVERDKFFKIVD